MKRKRNWRLQSVSERLVSTDHATLGVVGTRRSGHRPYIWIGGKGCCYGTITDPRSLRALANAILDALER